MLVDVKGRGISSPLGAHCPADQLSSLTGASGDKTGTRASELCHCSGLIAVQMVVHLLSEANGLLTEPSLALFPSPIPQKRVSGIEFCPLHGGVSEMTDRMTNGKLHEFSREDSALLRGSWMSI